MVTKFQQAERRRLRKEFMKHDVHTIAHDLNVEIETFAEWHHRFSTEEKRVDIYPSTFRFFCFQTKKWGTYTNLELTIKKSLCI